MTKMMAKEFMFIQINLNMKENGRMIIVMVKVKRYGQMSQLYLKDNS